MKVRRRSCAAAGAAVALAALGAFAGSADAQDPAPGPRNDRVPVNVMIVHTSNEQGGVDPAAKDLDDKLKNQLRYNSMRVIQQERVDLEVDRVGIVSLPDGRKVKMRPMHKGAKGVLMAVDVEGAVKLDARAPNHHKVVIGAGQYQDGNLAISIEPDYDN
jgi:hypothetical protein